MALVQLDELRDRIREAGDAEGTSGAARFSDAEVNSRINVSIKHWWDRVVLAEPHRYQAVDTITANGSASYAFPSDYYSTLALEYVDGDNRIEIPQISFHDRNRFGHAATSGHAMGFILTTAIEMVPPPSSGSYRHIYVTEATVLTNDTDTLEGIHGWEEWIVQDVAAYFARKDGADAVPFVAEREAIAEHIDRAAQRRRHGRGGTIADTRLRKRWWSRDPDFPHFGS